MYDVIIVGSGPAGVSAALQFSKESDLNVLIIDKQALPREKACGGAMPPSVEKILNLDLSPVIKNRTQILKFYHSYDNEVVRKTKGVNAPILVDRIEFDMFILKKALLLSPDTIEVMEGHEVTSIREEENIVYVLLNNGEKLQTKYLIAADGALGKIASMIELMKNRKFAQSFDIEIFTDSQYYDTYKNTMTMNYFCLPHGYGWIFPKENNKFSCGVGTWGKPLNLRDELDTFILKSFPKKTIKEIKILGYPIPIYQGTQQIATKRVLLTGDAAALVDPVSGEGIRFALHSGKIAASVIIESFENKKALSGLRVSEAYQKLINEEIGQELKFKLSFISLVFHNNPEFFYNKFVQK